MQKLTREEYSSEALQRRVRSVTFFKDLFQLDPVQYELVLSLSEFVRVKVGGTVMERGDVDGKLFFLLKGQISVYNEEGQQSLNVINPGEVVGTLSMITGRARSATVKAESNAILVGFEHRYFRDIQDHSLLNLSTKLLAFRMIVHNIRWTLEMNKMKEPTHPLVARLSKMPLLTGSYSFQEELEFLHKQSKVLAELLYDWNDAIVPLETPLSA
jgi:CRP/FNR family cyclic AMP-dependent transcriptional regulator